MPRPADPAVRDLLVSVAADMLARGEEPTLRKVASGAGTSTMAVYTYFDGMPGLLYAVRAQAFGALAEGLATLEETADPVADMVAAGAAYVRFGLAEPALYLAMFDIRRAHEQPAAASMTFAVLVAGVERAVAAGRLAARTDPVAAATRFWVVAHGVVDLVVNGALPPGAVDEHLPPVFTALLVALGDGPRKAARSVTNGWAMATEGV
jgi:AcrR family transcriptional regulator